MKINELIEKYQKLNLEQVIGYEKFNFYTITSHSTTIEGSTLTKDETTLLLDEGITPKGKPLPHSLMTKDYHEALLLALSLAKSKTTISVDMLKKINATVMQSTGKIHNTALGNIDERKGEIRKMNVSVSNRYFPNYLKVPDLLNDYCYSLNNLIQDCPLKKTEQLKISFWAHFHLVSIHPFCDGNGRTSRLIMNFVQQYFNLPLSLVYKEDKIDYFNALELSREKQDISIFYDFMFLQYEKYLNEEINRYNNQINEKNKGFSFLF